LWSGGWKTNPKNAEDRSVPQSVKRQLPVSLEDLYTGTTKRLKVTRKVMDPSTGRPSQTEKILTISIKPGWKAGTKIKFQGEGDELAPGGPSQDIEFILEEKPHPQFKREGDHLKTSVEIPLWEAICGFSRKISHLDGRSVEVSGAQGSVPVQPGHVIVLRGEGMPISKLPGKKGDLHVTVNVKFPSSVTEAQKKVIREQFSSSAAK
jgi:DnaJ family protein B protein 4